MEHETTTSAEETITTARLFRQSFIPGALAGVVADCFIHPMDTVRTRLQTGFAVLGPEGTSNAKAYKNTFDVLFKIGRYEGIRGLYSGFSSVATFTVPAHALYFAGYEFSKRYLLDGKKDLSAIETSACHFVSGFVAEIGGALIWTPMDVIKQRMQLISKTSNEARPGLLSTTRGIVAADGFFGLFRGFGAGLVVYGPFVGIYFTVYEQLKKQGVRLFNLPNIGPDPGSNLPLPYHLCSGATSGAVAAAITNPLDVIKTRLQVQVKSDPNSYRNSLDCFRRILREEGLKAFRAGLAARVMWIAPGSAITMAACLFSFFFLVLRNR